MKTGKRVLSVLLALLLLAVSVPLMAQGEDETTCKVGDCIQFGTYPQSRVNETEALRTAAESAVWKSYDYYLGTGNGNDGSMTPSDYMKFADFFYANEKYRAVFFSQYRSILTGSLSDTINSSQDDNNYELNTIYYFKYEPLLWRILDPTTGLIMCESIIDAQAYQNVSYSKSHSYYQGVGSSIYANNYATASIRYWLNLDFFETAFTDEQKSLIDTVLLNNNAYSSSSSKFDSPSTNDRIFLLSFEDALSSDYGFYPRYSDEDANRKAHGTDYAKCQGLSVPFQDFSGWWLRSPGDYSNGASYVYCYGNVSFSISVNSVNGIRPACQITALESDSSVSEYLLSAGTIAHNPGTAVRENAQSATCKTPASYESVIYCTICGEELSRETIYEGEPDPNAHDPQIGEVVEPTCTEDGYTPFICTRCGETVSKGDIVTAPGHSYNSIYNWAADNSTVTASLVCKRCQDVSTEETVGVIRKMVEASCTAPGQLTYTSEGFACKAFTVQTKIIPINQKPHATMQMREVSPTCTKEGVGSYWKCSSCNGIFEDEAATKPLVNAPVLPKTPHSPGKPVTKNETPASCTESGSYDEVVYCSDCGNELSRKTIKTVPLGHVDKNNDGKCDRCKTQLKNDTNTQPSGNVCKYCGEVHEGIFDKIIGFFHSILALFGLRK